MNDRGDLARPQDAAATGPAGAPGSTGRTRRFGPVDRARAWLVTGALGRGVAFVIDFAFALRDLLRARRRR